MEMWQRKHKLPCIHNTSGAKIEGGGANTPQMKPSNIAQKLIWLQLAGVAEIHFYE